MKASIALIAVICIVGVHSLTTEQFEKVKAEVEQCVRSNSIGQEIYEAIDGVFSPQRKAFACFSACIYHQNENMIADQESTDDQAKRCKDLKGGHDCHKRCLDNHNLIHNTQ